MADDRLRTSSYTIYVDLPDNDRELLLVHGYTGAYDRVSRRLADFLRSQEARRAPKPLYGTWSPEPIPDGELTAPSEAVIRTLRDRGYLTPLSLEDEEELFARLVRRLHRRASRSMPSYIFMPTYDCNLRCAYCFQDHMRSDGAFGHLLRRMAPAVIDRIFAALPEIEARHDVEPSQRRNIGFFGGEPLLAANRPVIEAIMNRARSLGEADFWAVTNATELEAYRDLLGGDGLNRLQITLDGPPEEHDRRRIYADGSGSFERIAANLTLALEHGATISVRLNVDRGNLDELPAIAAAIADRGWPAFSNFSVYTAPIHAANDKVDKKTTLNSWQLDQAVTAMHLRHPETRTIGRPDEGIRARARKIFAGDEDVLPQLKPSFCGAHDQMYIFDAFGDVYACWERTGDPSIRIARVTEAGEIEFRFEVAQEWRSRNVASNPVCKRCRYALHCGGGCAILALGQRGAFHANFCDGYAARFRASLAESYLAHVEGDQAPKHLDRVCDL